MARPLGFEVKSRDATSRARVARLTLPHGEVATPAFMAVGTRGAVKACTVEQVLATNTPIVLGNTYHLALRPGADVVKTAGGLHKFTGWPRPMLTDSGGFQVFSLAKIRDVGEDAVRFRSSYDGSLFELGPERSIEIQNALGADVIMAFDECAPFPCEKERVAAAVARTTRWARRSVDAHARKDDQALFGIIQGGVHDDLREESAAALRELAFDGYAIGGLSVGETPEKMADVLARATPLLPEDRPRYLMGVGTPLDILRAVACGVDMFDCVMPTRNARNAQVFTWSGRPLKLRNARHRLDQSPIDPECSCATCRAGFSRSYLRHLFSVDELTSYTLATIHNLTFYQDFMAKIRGSIENGTFDAFSRDWIARDVRSRDTLDDDVP